MSITKLNCMELKDTRYSVYPYDGYNLEEILGKFYEAIKECNDLSFSLQEFNNWIISEGLTEEVLKQLTKIDWDNIVNSELYQTVIERLLNTNNRIEEVKNELSSQLDNFVNENERKFEEVSSTLENISIQLDEFIVNGESDYTNAFIRANAKLSNGGTILLSCKEYNYSDIITLSNNVSLMCLNGYATLKALNLQKSCIKFGNNSRIENIILKSETTVRDSLDTSTKLYTNGADNVKIRNVIINGANSAGMLMVGLTNFIIENCVVRNTKADGIHITNGCKNGIVQNNFVYNVGDDGIACVSYQEKGNQVENIKILNNTVTNSNARGITNIGSKDITIKNNTIDGTNAGGILVAHESGYNTYTPSNTKITENTITNFSKNNENGAILLTGFDDEEGSLIRGNSVDGTTEGTKRKGITIDGCSNVNITDNYLYNTSHCIRTGNYGNPSSQKRLQNIKVNNNRTKKCSAAVFISTDFLDVSNNNFIETIADAGREMFVGKAKYGVFGNNTVTNASGTKGILKFEDLFDSIVNFNNANVQYGFTSDKNPYNDSYEWDNKIMEGQGVTIPMFNPSAGHRCGKFGTMAVSSDGTSLKVRVAQNTWKTIQMA